MLTRSRRREGTAASQPGPVQPKSLGEVLKEQILLVSFLVTYAGVIATDSYYATLSIGYQFLSLPPSHLIYRGITALFAAPALLLVYVVAVAVLITDDHFTRSAEWYGRWRTTVAYSLMIILLAVTLPLARSGGIAAARADLSDATSTFPRVHLRTATEDLKPEQHWRLVLQAGGHLAVVQALTTNDYKLNAKPLIRYFPESAIMVLETEPR